MAQNGSDHPVDLRIRHLRNLLDARPGLVVAAQLTGLRHHVIADRSPHHIGQIGDMRAEIETRS